LPRGQSSGARRPCRGCRRGRLRRGRNRRLDRRVRVSPERRRSRNEGDGRRGRDVCHPQRGHGPGGHRRARPPLPRVPRRSDVPAVSFLPYALAAWLFFVGLYGVVTSRNLVHLVICLGVVQSSTYVLLLAIGYRTGKKAPIFTS